MEKTLSLGAFTELSEKEIMETEGGGNEVSDETWGSWKYWQDFGAKIYEITHNDIKGELNIIGAVRNHIKIAYNESFGSKLGYPYIWEVE